MEEWQEGCQLCRARGQGRCHHKLEACEDELGERARGQLEVVRRSQMRVPYSCCYDCQLPQEVCDSFKKNLQNGGNYKVFSKTCQYKGVLEKMFVAACLAQNTKVQLEVAEAMQNDGVQAPDREMSSKEAFMRFATKWMCQKQRQGGIKGNNLSQVIRRVMECVEY